MNKQQVLDLFESCKSEVDNWNDAIFEGDFEQLADAIIKLSESQPEPKQSAGEIEEAKSFIKQWPNQDDYINENIERFLTEGEADDNSISLENYWEEQHKIAMQEYAQQVEVPSDEEIENNANIYAKNNLSHFDDKRTSVNYLAFIDCVKWLKQQIK